MQRGRYDVVEDVEHGGGCADGFKETVECCEARDISDVCEQDKLVVARLSVPKDTPCPSGRIEVGQTGITLKIENTDAQLTYSHSAKLPIKTERKSERGGLFMFSGEPHRQSDNYIYLQRQRRTVGKMLVPTACSVVGASEYPFEERQKK